MVVLLAAGCSTGGGRSAPALTEVWQLRSVTPIAQPRAAGAGVVVYGTVGKDLFLYGVAVADGAVRWRQAASPSSVVGGIPVYPRVIDDRVAYFRPEPSAKRAARLVVASPETGTDLLVSAPAVFVSHPESCADGKDICVMVRNGAGVHTSQRFSVDGGGPVPDAAPPDSRSIGKDLLDLGKRQPEILAGFHGGTVRWRAPIAHLFSADHSTDYGWHFELYESVGLHIGSVGHPPDRQLAATVFDWSRSETAAINAATGDLAWRSESTSFACDGKVALPRRVAAAGTELWPVRCRYRGRSRFDRAGQSTTYDSLDVTIEGFDVVTGKTTWSVPLGAAEDFMRDDLDAAEVGETEVLVRAATGPVIVDLFDGTTRAPAKGEVLWCSQNVVFEYSQSRASATGGTSSSWRGGTLLRRCTPDGLPVTAAPTYLPRSLGATVGDRTVVADAGGLVAYDRAVR